MEGLGHYPQQVVNKEAEARLHSAGGGECTQLGVGVCDKDGEKAQHPQLSFLRNRVRRLKSPQLGELCFVLKIEFPAFFSCQMSLLKKKKAKFHKWFAKTCRRLKRQTRPRDIL